MTNTRVRNGSTFRRAGAVLMFVLLTASFVMVPAAISAPDDVEKRVEAILSRMTLDQKIDLIGGQDEFYIRAYPELG